MNIGLSLSTSLTQKLTPQQVQYLKLLQLNSLQLEQYLRQELELNPMLEVENELEQNTEDEISQEQNDSDDEPVSDSEDAADGELTEVNDSSEDDDWQEYIEDESGVPAQFNDDREPIPIRDTQTFVEELLDQVRLLNLSDSDLILAEEIIWSIEPNGYLLRSLEDIVVNANAIIAAVGENRDLNSLATVLEADSHAGVNHATAWGENTTTAALASADRWNSGEHVHSGFAYENAALETDAGSDVDTLTATEPGRKTLADAERILHKIQQLDPPGIGSRNLRECLIAQLDAMPRRNAAQKLARLVLECCYEAFTKKHFDIILRELRVSEDYLREALDLIRTLNPKPGGGEATLSTETIIPDFFVVHDEDKDDFLVYLNDSRIPAISINRDYEQMRVEARKRKYNTETRQWLRRKHDDAKFLLHALKQRRETMRKVITALVHRQREFFKQGESGIKPMIQKDVAEDTGLDISTISRVVNGKYVQTEYGVFELKYFFSESLSTDDGEEVSTRIIKNKLRELIEAENKNKPLSDQKLGEQLKESGFNVARRTVAKYREQLNIPVARLRKEL